MDYGRSGRGVLLVILGRGGKHICVLPAVLRDVGEISVDDGLVGGGEGVSGRRPIDGRDRHVTRRPCQAADYRSPLGEQERRVAGGAVGVLARRIRHADRLLTALHVGHETSCVVEGGGRWSDLDSTIRRRLSLDRLPASTPPHDKSDRRRGDKSLADRATYELFPLNRVITIARLSPGQRPLETLYAQAPKIVWAMSYPDQYGYWCSFGAIPNGCGPPYPSRV